MHYKKNLDHLAWSFWASLATNLANRSQARTRRSYPVSSEFSWLEMVVSLGQRLRGCSYWLTVSMSATQLLCSPIVIPVWGLMERGGGDGKQAMAG